MPRILVVTYSRTGTAVGVGKQLASLLEADFERIEEAQNRSGALGYMISALEALAKGLPSIRTTKDPSEYDVVVVGTPVWAGNMASPIRAYLTLHRAQLKHVALFAVMAGHGGDQVVRDMKLLARADDAPSCALSRSEIVGPGFASKLATFAHSITLLARRVSAPLSDAADASTWIGDDREQRSAL